MDTLGMKKKVAISVIAQVAGQLLAGILGIVVLKVMTHALGVRVYGIYATSLAFVSTFSLLTELGLNTITTREVAKSPERAEEIISQNMGLRLFLAIVMIPLISGLGFLVYPHAIQDLRFGILLFSIYLIFDAIWATSVTYFTAKIRNDIPATITAGQQTLFFLVAIAVAAIGWGLFGFIAAYVVTISVGALVALFVTRRRINGIRPRANLKLWRKSFSISIALGTMSVINVVYAKADSILLSIYKGTTDVGIYGVAYSLINTFIYLSNYIMGSLIPAMANSSKEELERIVQRSFHFMFTLSCLLVIDAVTVQKNIILTVSNSHFIAAAAPFAILAFATAFSYLNNVFTYACVATNKHHRIIYISLCSLALNVGANILLIPRFGLIGAAWVTVLSEIFVSLSVYRILHKETGVSVSLGVTLKPLIAASLSFGSGIGLHGLWSTSNVLFNTLSAGTTVGIIYFILLYALGGLPVEMKTFLDRLFHVGMSQLKLRFLK